MDVDLEPTAVDLSLASIGRHGTYEEYAFFDRVKRLLGNKDTYMNFMRCVNLYVDDVISERDLLLSIQPFTAKFPEIARQIRELFGLGVSTTEPISQSVVGSRLKSAQDVNMDIDYASCRKQGASYRPLPASYEPPICSGRDKLCNSVLNDIWVSFPLWSEDTTLQFGETKISAYQEFLYRCEDERFELDIVIENISSTVDILSEVSGQMERMSPEDARKHQLDDNLGGTSEVLQKKAIQRIYGDKAEAMIDGLKKRPAVALPIVLRRLVAKVAEWRSAQQDFNQTWREQNDKQLAKSLTADAGGFRQIESRAIRSKSLLNEAMAVHEENQALQLTSVRRSTRPMEFFYDGSDSVLYDATSLLLFHVEHCGIVPIEDVTAIRDILVEVLPRLLDVSPSNRRCLNPLLTDAYRVMYSNSTFYIFIRLHHRLCQRIKKIRSEADRISSTNRFTGSELTSPHGVISPNLYEHTLSMIKCLSEGVIEAPSYEDILRKTYGRHASVTFTVDRLLQHIIKQLQTMVTDETCKDVVKLFTTETTTTTTTNTPGNFEAQVDGGGVLRKREVEGWGGAEPRGSVLTDEAASMAEFSVGDVGRGGATPKERCCIDEGGYRMKVFELLGGEELCFRITFYRVDCRLRIEIMEMETEPAEDPLDVLRWTDYIAQLADVESSAQDVDIVQLQEEEHGSLPVLLNRCVRRCKRRRRSNSPVVVDNSLCQFDVNSYRMNFAANSSSYYYVPGTLTTSKKNFTFGADVQACQIQSMAQRVEAE